MKIGLLDTFFFFFFSFSFKHQSVRKVQAACLQNKGQPAQEPFSYIVGQLQSKPFLQWGWKLLAFIPLMARQVGSQELCWFPCLFLKPELLIHGAGWRAPPEPDPDTGNA